MKRIKIAFLEKLENNTNMSIQDLIELKEIHPSFNTYFKRLHKYYNKYAQELYTIYTFEDYKKFFKAFCHQQATNKTNVISLDTFKLYGMKEKHYELYCKNKTKKFDFSSETQQRRSLMKTKDMETNPEKYKGIQPNQKEYWLKQGYTEEEAIMKVKERQTTFSLDICIAKYGKEEGLKRFNERQDKWQKTLNDKPQEEIDDINRRKNVLLKKTPEEVIEFKNKCKERMLDKKFQEKIRKIHEDNNYWIKKEDMSDWKVYSNNVRKSINRTMKTKKGYHRDHMFSVKEGFENNIPTYIIANINNLEHITAEENLKKSWHSSITKEELFLKVFSKK